MKLDRNQIIGFILIFGLFILYSVMNAPSDEELAEKKRIQDSIALSEQALVDPTIDTSALRMEEKGDTAKTTTTPPDSVVQAQQSMRYGAFGPAGTGQEQTRTLENDLMIVTFSNKGGRITSVELKEYDKIIKQPGGEDIISPVRLLEDEKDVFSYLLPIPSASTSFVKTGDLYFQAQTTDNSITFTATGQSGLVFKQSYSLSPGSYTLDYNIQLEGGDGFVDPQAAEVALHWNNYLDKIEDNSDYERYYSTVYFKPVSDDIDYCSCRKSDTEEVDKENLKWVSHSNQFFNSSLIADNHLGHGRFETVMLEEDAEDLKLLKTEINLPIEDLKGAGGIDMQFYIGPNDFENLMAFDTELEDIVPFGSSIFGTINRWVIRPMFNFLSNLVSNKGIVILLLTFIVKLLLFPLTYKMLYSQVKMGTLKPEIAHLREKHKDDMQKQQMETMKLYREYGVSPLGGCLPMFMQMPIWFALYRFFPASIEFRQASFLWAHDLSSFDVLFYLPFDIPMYGAHVSLFTILWAGTTLAYTYYNTKMMDMGNMNPMMKYMQYLMPVMFLAFFNSYASGLTLYLLYSNVLNIAQTLSAKRFLFNEDKIKAGLNLNKEKPKKKTGFQARLEKALQEQQRIAKEKESQGKGKRKKG